MYLTLNCKKNIFYNCCHGATLILLLHPPSYVERKPIRYTCELPIVLPQQRDLLYSAGSRNDPFPRRRLTPRARRFRDDKVFPLDIERYYIVFLTFYCVPYRFLFIGRLH